MEFQSKPKLLNQLKVHVLQFLCAKIRIIQLFKYSEND